MTTCRGHNLRTDTNQVIAHIWLKPSLKGREHARLQEGEEEQ